MSEQLTIRALASILLAIISTLSYAQSGTDAIPSWKVLSQSSLSNNSIRCIAVDETGYMWIGTNGGLNRWNGHSYRYYYETGDGIFSLCPDTDNRIWVGTSKGVSLIHDSNYTEYSNASFQPVFDIAIVDDETLVYSSILGIYMLDKMTKSNTILTSFPQEEHICMGFDRSTGNLAAVTKLNNTLHVGNLFSDNPCIDIELPKQNTAKNIALIGDFILIGTDNGLICYKKNCGKWVPAPIAPNLEKLTQGRKIDILKLTPDNPFHFYLGTNNLGLVEFDFVHSEVSHQFCSADSWNSSDICTIAPTEFGVSICIDNTNIKTYSKSGFSKTYEITNDKSTIHKVQVSRDASKIVTVSNSQVTLYDIKTNTTKDITPSSIASMSQVTFSLLDLDLNLWIFSDSNTLEKYPFRNDEYGQKLSYNIKQTEAVWLNAYNDLTIASADGLTIIQSTGAISKIPISGLDKNIIWYGYTLSNGNVILSTMEDETLLVNKDHTLIENTLGIDGTVNSFLEASDKSLWYSITGNGLYHYNQKDNITTRYTIANGLYSNTVTTISEDHNGNIWVLNSNKLTVINSDKGIINTLNPTGDEAIGIRSIPIDMNGMLYLTSGNKIIALDTEAFINDVSTRAVPSIHIEGMSLANGPLQSIDRSIKISQKNMPLSIFFSSSDITGLSDIQYTVKMDRYDKDWHAIGNMERVDYSHLSRGKHTLRIRTIDSYGKMMDNESSATFVIKVSPLVSYFAIAIYICILLSIAYYIITLINRHRSDKQKIALSEQEKLLMEKINKEKIDFFTNINHEYRTPLTLICAPAKELMKCDDAPEHIKMQAKLISSNAERLLGLSEQILSFNKIENSVYDIKARNHNLEKMIRNMAEDFSYQIDNKGLHLGLNFSSLPSQIYYDSDKIDKILFNLLSNAIKYTDNGGHINISTNTIDSTKAIEYYGVEKLTSLDGTPYNGNYMEIVVSDDGIGIAKDKVSKLFSRYERLLEDKDSIKGYGIGLNLSMQLAVAHHGTIKAEDNSPKGTRMCLVFPIDEVAFQKNEIWINSAINDTIQEEAAAHGNVQESTDNSSTMKNLIIAEDNTQLRGYLKDLLTMAGYRVFTAINGEDAMDLINDIECDLIISDVIMPIKNGFELCDSIKTSQDYSHIPIILLTALSDTDNQIQGLKTGADAYIKKPFDNGILLATIENLIKNRQSLHSLINRMLSNGDLIENTVSDESTQAVEANDQTSIKLSTFDQAFLDKLMAMIEREISNESFDLADMYDEMAMGRSTFYKKVKGLTGLGPQQFMTSIRMNRAMNLLRKGEITASEVCFEVGYSTLSGFSKQFKKQFGIPPGSVKKQSST